ncbi:hypothetical protein [Acidithiobacillus sp.]
MPNLNQSVLSAQELIQTLANNPIVHIDAGAEITLRGTPEA